jgi:hypothetical protein
MACAQVEQHGTSDNEHDANIATAVRPSPNSSKPAITTSVTDLVIFDCDGVLVDWGDRSM